MWTFTKYLVYLQNFSWSNVFGKFVPIVRGSYNGVLKVHSFNKVDLTIPCNLRDAKQNFSATILLKPQLAQQQESTMKKWQNPLVGFHIDQSCIFHIWPKPNIHLWKTLALGTEDGRFTSICLLYGQLSQGRMADFPAFIASKSFYQWNHHIAQMKWHNFQHILMY